MLVSLWVVCRVLQNIGSQIMHANGTSGVAINFANTLRSVLCQVYAEPRGSVQGLLDILQAFVGVSPSDLADTLSICSLCTCRTISATPPPDSPIVLDAWVDHQRNRGLTLSDRKKLMNSYEEALNRMSGACNDSSISLLQNCATAAYYIFQDRELTSPLANQLWQLTRTVLHQEPRIFCRNVKTQALVEAAKLKALVRCITHENKHMNSKKLKALQKSLNLQSKRARRRWRASLDKPPSAEDTRGAMEAMGTVAGYLEDGDLTCLLAAADLRELYARLIREFGQGKADERCQAGNYQREQAAQLRATVFLQFDLVNVET